MKPKTLLDTDVLSGLMRKTPAALSRARAYLAEHRQLTISLITQFNQPPRRQPYYQAIDNPARHAQEPGRRAESVAQREDECPGPSSGGT